MKTYTARAGEVESRWLLVDAEGQTLGRLATHISMALRGKNKPTYTPHMDTGDHVIIVNASKVRLTGAKVDKQQVFRHTMYPDGVRWTALKELMVKYPERVVITAIRGMLPKTKLGRAMIKKLKVYAGQEHPHAAQMPVAWAPTSATRKGE